jgi:glycosyltransferase involved in cell wall biosynthesis
VISGVIPAYNEEADLEKAVRSLTEVFEHFSPSDWELLIVDDGSRDHTCKIASSLSKAPRISLLCHDINRGKGAAVRTGVMQTKGDRVLIFDADMSTPPAMLGRFLSELANGADIVTGDRRTRESRIERPQPLLRRYMGGVYISLARMVTGIPLTDFNCGFKLFQGEAARTLLSKCRSDRWAWDVEVIALAVRQGLTVRAIPVTWRQGDRSSIRPFRAAVGSLAEIVSLSIRLRSSGD